VVKGVSVVRTHPKVSFMPQHLAVNQNPVLIETRNRESEKSGNSSLVLATGVRNGEFELGRFINSIKDHYLTLIDNY
jgi:hypothetical protein